MFFCGTQARLTQMMSNENIGRFMWFKSKKRISVEDKEHIWGKRRASLQSILYTQTNAIKSTRK